MGAFSMSMSSVPVRQSPQMLDKRAIPVIQRVARHLASFMLMQTTHEHGTQPVP